MWTLENHNILLFWNCNDNVISERWVESPPKKSAYNTIFMDVVDVTSPAKRLWHYTDLTGADVNRRDNIKVIFHIIIHHAHYAC